MEPTLHIEKLSVTYARRERAIMAVREISLKVHAGECVGIVGESGSGKTQAFMAVMGLLGGTARAAGSVRFEGGEILNSARADLNQVRGSRLSMIFQDPMTSLTPHLRIGVQLTEVLVQHRRLSSSAARQAALEMLERVRIPDARRRLQQYPHELSGGMRQRVMIGMSVLCEPSLVIADEPTTALDVTVQAQIIDLFRAMRVESRMAMVLISHDFGVVAGLSDRIAVMYAGRVVEHGPALAMLRWPMHPYTSALLKCVPNLHEPRVDLLPSLPGQPPHADGLEMGCAFALRCPRVAALCHVERPPLLAPDAAGHEVACHFPLSA